MDSASAPSSVTSSRAAASTAARLSPARCPGDLTSTTVRRPVKLYDVQLIEGGRREAGNRRRGAVRGGAAGERAGRRAGRRRLAPDGPAADRGGPRGRAAAGRP